MFDMLVQEEREKRASVSKSFKNHIAKLLEKFICQDFL